MTVCLGRWAGTPKDGKPIFLQLGVHHAREWPSSEHAIEFAYDLLTNYGASARTTGPAACAAPTRTTGTCVDNPAARPVRAGAAAAPEPAVVAVYCAGVLAEMRQFLRFIS